MAYIMKTNIANRANYGNKRSTSSIKYIVIHYTGNDGDSDEANARFFDGIRYASAHYFVDGDSVTQVVYDNYVAYSVGGYRYGNYKSTGGAKYYNKCTNANSISIELCDDVKNGKVYPSAKTIENALELTRKLMEEYNIPKERVIRHFDVVGKSCPAYWCGTASKNEKWKTAFWNKIDDVPDYKVGNTYVLQQEMNVRTGAAASYAKKLWKQLTKAGQKCDKDKDGALDKGTKITCKKISKKSNGDIWIKCPSGWIKAFDASSKKVYIK